MDNEDKLDRFRKILNPYVTDKPMLDKLNENTNLVTDLKINSAHVVDVVLDAENEFGVEIDYDSFDQMTTVGSCLDIIQTKENARDDRK